MPMIGILLSAAAALAPNSDVDAASLAYTQCLFATSRAASGERLSASAFEQRLAGACHDEQRSLERRLAKALASQGHCNTTAEAKGLAEDARQTVIDNYRRMLELEPELSRLAEMCKANPEQCRD